MARGFLFDAWLEVELKALEASDRAGSRGEIVRTHDSKGAGCNGKLDAGNTGDHYELGAAIPLETRATVPDGLLDA